jgi:UDP-N-acetyl-D-mannosaminuronate dehydrogenase
MVAGRDFALVYAPERIDPGGDPEHVVTIEAAATKPFGYRAFWPGPGVGGHYIAIDLAYLSWKVGQVLGYRISFVEHTQEVNEVNARDTRLGGQPDRRGPERARQGPEGGQDPGASG